ncbi:hypothetical protein PMAYCL1PPCAC_14944, partial [Pristionchus mayeri]
LHFLPRSSRSFSSTSLRFADMSFLPFPLPGHDLFTIIHHSIVDFAAIIFNLLLLLAVVLRSPAGLRSYKILLLNSAIIDLLSSSTMLLAMIRLIPARHVLAFTYAGPCAYFSGIFCHCFYTIMLATLSQSLFLIATSFGYRLYILGRSPPNNKTVSIVCLIVAIPNLMIVTTFTFMLDDSDDVRTLMRELKPEYDLDDYVMEGILSIFNVGTMFTILALTMPIGPTLIIIFIVRNKVLTLQSMLPVFCSGAIGSYGLCQFDIACSPVQEHFIMESVSFMALFAPIITLYCMKPYKE